MSTGVNRRRALVMADQGVSSLSNVVVSIFAAQSLTSDEFGAFGLAVVVCLLAQGTSRAVIGEPLLSRFSATDAATRRRLVPDILGAALVVSLIGVVLATVTSIVVSGLAGSALLALAPVLPLLLLHDTWRYVFIIDRPGSALAADLVWMLAVFVALSLAPTGAGPAWYVTAWGAAAGLGAIAGTALGRASLGRPRPLAWVIANRDMGSRFLGEFATGQAVGQVVLVVVGAISGLTALGAVRAAQVIYGPLNTVHQGIYLALVPEGARAGDVSQLRRLMVKASIALSGIAAVWMLVVLLVPDSWGTALFEDTWSEAGDLMLPMGLAMVAGSAATGGFAGVRALGAARESLRARLRTVAPQLVLPLAGAIVLGGGVGYAVGFGLGHTISAAIWWAAFASALSTRKLGPEGESVETVPPAAHV